MYMYIYIYIYIYKPACQATVTSLLAARADPGARTEPQYNYMI